MRRYGDTDIFPTPFEFDSIAAAWPWLRDELGNRDLATYALGPSQRFLVPKPNGGFRPAVQLDPIDSIVFLAMIYEALPQLEAARVPADRRIACSYRIDVAPDGRLFREDNGWPDFQERSRELITNGAVTHVVMADISDFYNSIYHHRLENSLATAGVSEVRRKDCITFINQLTATQSTGIPVGPFASIILAEACMTDVDNMLLRKGYVHTRYVDDFRIFCTSRREAWRAMHDLSEYLYSAHRLNLEASKSRIITAQVFADRELVDPEDLDQAQRDEIVAALLAGIQHAGPYGNGEAELDEETLDEATRQGVADLFETCVSERPLQLGLARYLLRKAARLRTHVLVDLVFANLPTLTPVLRDVARYVKAAMRKQFSPVHHQSLLQFLTASDVSDLPFVQLWAVEIMRTVPAVRDDATLISLCERYVATLGLRPAALAALTLQREDWVRGRKETWRSSAEWDRRAILEAGRILPADERKHWLGYVEGVSTGLDRAVAQSAAA